MNNLSDNEIIKAFECCFDKNEIIVSFYEPNETKTDLTIQDVLDFINRLCETIEKGDYTSYTAQIAKQSWHTQNSEYIEKLEAENERLQNKLNTAKQELIETIPLIEDDIKTAKYEARKEFAERLKDEVTYYEDACGNFVPFVDCRDIDNLLKEMGCE